MANSGNPDVLANGDTFDEDSGEFLGNLTYSIPKSRDEFEEKMDNPPANISIYINGFWYQYKLDKKVDAKETNDEQEKAS